MYRSFVVVSVLTTLTATLGMLIDNIIVAGTLGVNALGAMGIATPISLVFSAVSNICSSGGATHAARALGKGDTKSVNNIFTGTMLFVLSAGAVLTAAGLAFTAQIAGLFGAEGELLQPATEYLRGFFLGATPTILVSALMGFVKIDGSTRLPLECIAVMTVSNIALDLIVIYVFDLGMFGIGLATSLAYCLAALMGLTHFRKKHCTLRLCRPSNLIKELGAIIATGAPTALSRVCDTLKMMTLNHLMVMAAGASAVAALNVRTQTYNLIGAIIMGVSQAAVPVAAVFYGEEDRSALQSTLKEVLRLGLMLSTAAGLLLLAFPAVIPSAMVKQDAEALQMATMAVRFFAVGMPLQLVNMAMMNMYQATRNTVKAMIICLLQQLVFTTGFALVLSGPMGANGIWLAFLLGEVCTLGFIGISVLVRRRGKVHELADVLLLEKDFGGDPQERFEKTIPATLEEAVLVSEELYAFGNQRGLSRKFMHSVALCVEEMAGNVAVHSRKKGMLTCLCTISLVK